MTESMICHRAFEFACRLFDLCDRFCERGPSARHIASQLVRCGTSVGSNAEEAQEGQSKADFIAKLSISSKEARETRWWLSGRHNEQSESRRSYVGIREQPQFDEAQFLRKFARGNRKFHWLTLRLNVRCSVGLCLPSPLFPLPYQRQRVKVFHPSTRTCT